MAALDVTAANGVKIYNLTSGKSLPDWLKEKQRLSSRQKQLRNLYRSRIELIQDFDYPISASKIKLSRDGKYLATTGIYPPQLKVFEFDELSMKFERHLDCEVQQFEILTDDFSKILLLRRDRYIEFHAKFGPYYSTRVPKFARDMSYHYISCDLFTCGAGSEIYRLNLEQGRFLQPWTSNLSNFNVCKINPVHSLFAFGGEQGVVECWDPRTHKPIGQLSVGSDILDHSQGLLSEEPEITAMRFDGSGILLAVGSESGQVVLYDIRSSNPMLIKDHYYAKPLVDIKFHPESRNVVSSCQKAIKIWDKDQGTPFCTIEPPKQINDVAIVPKSGLIFVAPEDLKMYTYYIPTMGSAPAWCSFLDSLTEELEAEKETPIYSDYKFITLDEIQKLGIERLIGTPFLRAYMHGYFMDIRFYLKLRAIARPDEYKQYVQEKIKNRLEEKRASRIKVTKINKTKDPQINIDLMEKLQKSSKGKKLIEDPRFNMLFQDERYKIEGLDENNTEENQNENPVPETEQEEPPEQTRLYEEESADSSSDSVVPPSVPDDADQDTNQERKTKSNRKRKFQEDKIRTRILPNFKKEVSLVEELDIDPMLSKDEQRKVKRLKRMEFGQRIGEEQIQKKNMVVPSGPISFTFTAEEEDDKDRRGKKKGVNPSRKGKFKPQQKRNNPKKKGKK